MVPQVDANVAEKHAGVSLLGIMFNDAYRCKTRVSELTMYDDIQVCTVKKVKQSRYTPWRRLWGEEI
jgi:hypothetical protein